MLQKITFRAGINRESTTLANEGGWYGGDKIRFRSGQVEKIGGWSIDSGVVYTTGNIYQGVCRSLKNWTGLTGYNYLGIGTNTKFYIQNYLRRQSFWKCHPWLWKSCLRVFLFY